MKIAVTPSSFAAVDGRPLDRLKSTGLAVVMNTTGRRLTRDEVVPFLSTAVGVVAGLEPLDAEVLQALPSLKAIARVGIGMDNIDLPFAKERGLKISNTPEPPTNAVAELTLAAALCLVRDLRRHGTEMREGRWTKSISGSLSGARVLIIGLGRIGSEVARRFECFGAEIAYFDPFAGDHDRYRRFLSLSDGLRWSGIVSIHASGREELIGAAELDCLPDGFVLLNPSRGELVNEDALEATIRAGKARGVWFDAFWREPYHGTLSQYPETLLTPHVSTYTGPCRLDMEMQAVENIIADLAL